MNGDGLHRRAERLAELRSLLRRLKLGRSLDTLPERLALARQNTSATPSSWSSSSPMRSSAGTAPRPGSERGPPHLDPAMVLDAWDDTAEVTFDRALWSAS